MEIVIAGGHGKIALLTEQLLADAGHTVRALIRNPAHDGDVEAAGAQPVVADLEQLDPAAGGAPGRCRRGRVRRRRRSRLGGRAQVDGGLRRRGQADRGVPRAGVQRYVMVSGRGADATAPDDGGFNTYLRAKGQADAELQSSGLRYTILRPVGLTDDPATDAISTAPDSGVGTIPRADVAAVIVAVLDEPRTAGQTIVLRSGAETVAAAIESLLQ